MPLCTLVLLHVINQNFQPATYPTMIEVETKPPNLKGLATSFMLAGVDAGVQTLKQLIVAQKERVLVHRVVASIDGGI